VRGIPLGSVAHVGDSLALCYHAVSEHWPAPLSVTPERLERQLGTLARRGYRAVTFGELVARRSEDKRVAVTFDDAYRSVHRLAVPIMRRLGMVGTVFVPTDFAGRDEPMRWPGIDQWLAGPHQAELMPMSWEELGELGESGWELGSHTRSHPRLTRVGDDQLPRELCGSREELERRLGRRCPSLAYPYGDHDSRVVRAAGECGFEAGGTLPGPLPRPQPLAWPRIGIYHGDGEARFLLKVARSGRWLRGSAAYRAAALMRAES
jgi:peptidoglycan/xylan/chitin deacetylase (PgdA/CDA1 family)